MWSEKNGIPKSSWICLLPTYQGALVAIRRHLDCNTCSLLICVCVCVRVRARARARARACACVCVVGGAADRQIGHA
jgi:hypothetical protein